MTDLGWLLPTTARVTSGWNLSRVDPVHHEKGVVAHYGWDFGCAVGSPLVAPFAGHVKHYWPIDLAGFTSPHPMNGNCLVLVPDAADCRGITGFERLWLHLSKSLVVLGSKFTKGDVIAYSGNTGYVAPAPTAENPHAGAHLHDELHLNGQPVDLALYYGGRLHL